MLDLNSFYPSTLIALDDPILMQSFLKFVISSFVKNGNPKVNPVLSPVFAPDSILAKFPPTRIMACEADPLRDPAFEFALRLQKLGVDIRMYLMKDYIHGFNSFD
jgi:acetyl esterase/lipase